MSASSTAEQRFGITNFTYRARRPMSAKRLNDVLGEWPEPNKDNLVEFLGEASTSAPSDGMAASPFTKVIRAKGFCWLDSHPSSRLYFNYAGNHCLISYEGVWWGAMPTEELHLMLNSKAKEYERAKAEDWADIWEDRRQELVFIGTKLDKAAITTVLDTCLLTDEELEEYRAHQEVDARELAKEWQVSRRVNEY